LDNEYDLDDCNNFDCDNETNYYEILDDCDRELYNCDDD
jgi:hypothetical protein